MGFHAVHLHIMLCYKMAAIPSQVPTMYIPIQESLEMLVAALLHKELHSFGSMTLPVPKIQSAYSSYSALQAGQQEVIFSNW